MHSRRDFLVGTKTRHSCRETSLRNLGMEIFYTKDYSFLFLEPLGPMTVKKLMRNGMIDLICRKNDKKDTEAALQRNKR